MSSTQPHEEADGALHLKKGRIAAAIVLASSAGFLGYSALDLSGAARIYPSLVWFSLTLLLLAHATYLSFSEIEGVNKHAVQELDRVGWLRLAGFTLVWLTYAYVLGRIGFLTATTVALTVSLLTLRPKATVLRIVSLASVFAALTVVLFLLLQVVLNIPLPQRALDRIVSDWAYSIF